MDQAFIELLGQVLVRRAFSQGSPITYTILTSLLAPVSYAPNMPRYAWHSGSFRHIYTTQTIFDN